MSRLVLLVALVALVCTPVLADVYMQNPRGSNNRLKEQSAARNNGDRLFDSQNNDRGGYNVGDRGVNPAENTNDNQGVESPAYTFNAVANNPADTNIKIQYQMVYYEGSELSVEWTAQHGCGGNEADDPHKLNCDLILQYMCQTTDGEQLGSGALKVPTKAGVVPGAESLRDGFDGGDLQSMGNYKDFGKVTTNLNKGHHESEAYYYSCEKRGRNQGLFLADKKIGDSAKNTRQNPNGNRNGLECPEERDYYPYWSPSPWKDIVIMTDHVDKFCDENGVYKGASQNVAKTGRCEPAADANDAAAEKAITANTETKCETAGGVWVLYSHDIPAPKCQQAGWSRVNHLGNGRDGQPLTYNWTLPSIDDLAASGVHMYADGAASFAKCVLRLRYNISTDDYDPYNTTSLHNNNPNAGVISPVTNNPTVDIGAGYEGVKLAVNTAQFGRTFQDRSHVFYIRSRPTNIPAGAKVYNLNVRGKRGNIVQTFPATEYDFQPSRLVIEPSDFVHVQWTGSNTHNNGNPGGDGQTGDAGEGRGGTDRHNIAQLLHFSQNYPMPLDKFPDNMWSRSDCFLLNGNPLSTLPNRGVDIMEASAALDCAVYLTTSGQFRNVAQVAAAVGTATTFDPLLDNAPASLVGGVVMQFRHVTFGAGETSKSFDYMSTRNNNFSNRGQKATIVVKKPATA